LVQTPLSSFLIGLLHVMKSRSEMAPSFVHCDSAKRTSQTKVLWTKKNQLGNKRKEPAEPKSGQKEKPLRLTKPKRIAQLFRITKATNIGSFGGRFWVDKSLPYSDLMALYRSGLWLLSILFLHYIIASEGYGYSNATISVFYRFEILVLYFPLINFVIIGCRMVAGISCRCQTVFSRMSDLPIKSITKC
jgi:hypothetical protein